MRSAMLTVTQGVILPREAALHVQDCSILPRVAQPHSLPARCLASRQGMGVELFPSMGGESFMGIAQAKPPPHKPPPRGSQSARAPSGQGERMLLATPSTAGHSRANTRVAQTSRGGSGAAGAAGGGWLTGALGGLPRVKTAPIPKDEGGLQLGAVQQRSSVTRGGDKEGGVGGQGQGVISPKGGVGTVPRPPTEDGGGSRLKALSLQGSSVHTLRGGGTPNGPGTPREAENLWRTGSRPSLPRTASRRGSQVEEVFLAHPGLRESSSMHSGDEAIEHYEHLVSVTGPDGHAKPGDEPHLMIPFLRGDHKIIRRRSSVRSRSSAQGVMQRRRSTLNQPKEEVEMTELERHRLR